LSVFGLHFLQIYFYASEYAVERNGDFVILYSPMKIKRGELVMIDLFVSIPVARNFVVVNDPVPRGLEPVNSDLATSSIVDPRRGNTNQPEVHGGSSMVIGSHMAYPGGVSTIEN
jgi:hypothetical protein